VRLQGCDWAWLQGAGGGAAEEAGAGGGSAASNVSPGEEEPGAPARV